MVAIAVFAVAPPYFNLPLSLMLVVAGQAITRQKMVKPSLKSVTHRMEWFALKYVALSATPI
jgi:hypothetical protein